VRVAQYALNLENMYTERTCKRLGPVRVRRSKYPFFFFLNLRDLQKQSKKLPQNKEETTRLFFSF